MDKNRMFWQSLTDIQKYAVIGVLVMAIIVFGLPLLLIFLDRCGQNAYYENEGFES